MLQVPTSPITEVTCRPIAVAVNGGVIRRSAWPETTLADGDTVEIVGAVQGG